MSKREMERAVEDYMDTSSAGEKTRLVHKCGLICLLVTILAVLATYIGLGGVLVHNGNEIEELIAEPNAYLKRQLSDWEVKPFVDLKVLEGAN